MLHGELRPVLEDRTSAVLRCASNNGACGSSPPGRPCAGSRPLAFVLAIAGTALVATTATAERKLPPRTAEQLLVDVQQARGRRPVRHRDPAGQPRHPRDPRRRRRRQLRARARWSPAPTRCGSATPSPDKARLAVLGTYGETDVITQRQGPVDLVQPRTRRPPTAPSTPRQPAGARHRRPPADLPRTPQEAAEQVLAALEPTTTVTTDSDVTVAGPGGVRAGAGPERRRDPDQPGPDRRRRRDQDAAAGAGLRARAELVFEVGYDRSTSPGRRTASSRSIRRRAPR